MRRARILLPVFALLFGVVGTLTGPAAGAAESVAADPGKIVMERFEYVTPSSTINDTCLTFTFGVNGRYVTGALAFTFIQDVGWCFNGQTITYHNPSNRVGLTAGWTFDGVWGVTNQSDPGRTFWQDRSNGKFKYCLPAVGCINEANPWINTVVTRTGGHSGSGYSDFN